MLSSNPGLRPCLHRLAGGGLTGQAGIPAPTLPRRGSLYKARRLLGLGVLS